MGKLQFFCGIDVGKSELFVALGCGLEVIAESVFENTSAGLSTFLTWLDTHEALPQDTLIALEHTGVYADRVTRVTHGAAYTVWKINPLRLAQVQLGLDRAKDDPGDARKIAAFAARFEDQVDVYVPDKQSIKELKELSVLRRQVVDARQRNKNQLSSLRQKVDPSPFIITYHEGQIQRLTADIKEIEAQIKACIETDENLAQQAEILRSIPGVGKVVSTQVLTVTKGFSIFKDHRKLAAFAGTAPFPNCSGENAKRRKNKISKTGSKELKALLTTSVMATIRKGGYFHELYQILLKKPGVKPMQVINRIRNILLKLMFTLITKEEKFDPEIFKKNCKTWQNALTLT